MIYSNDGYSGSHSKREQCGHFFRCSYCTGKERRGLITTLPNPNKAVTSSRAQQLRVRNTCHNARSHNSSPAVDYTNRETYVYVRVVISRAFLLRVRIEIDPSIADKSQSLDELITRLAVRWQRVNVNDSLGLLPLFEIRMRIVFQHPRPLDYSKHNSMPFVETTTVFRLDAKLWNDSVLMCDLH